MKKCLHLLDTYEKYLITLMYRDKKSNVYEIHNNSVEILKDIKGGSDLLMEMFLTILSGVLVYWLSQLVNEYCIKPVQEFKNIKSKIAFDMVYYKNIIHTPDGLEESKCDKAITELRKDSAELIAFSIRKPIAFFPLSNAMQDCASKLIGLSNSINESENFDIDFIIENEKAIKKFIKIK